MVDINGDLVEQVASAMRKQSYGPNQVWAVAEVIREREHEIRLKLTGQATMIAALEEQLAQAQASLAAARAQALRIGDELNQCLQIIVTNAGNFPAGERMFPNEVKEAHECQRNIENAVKRAATAVRSLADIPSDSTALAKLRDDSQRMWDLVRYQRDELHEANLISDDEYALLAKDHAGVKRLESYDAVRASVAKLFAEERLALVMVQRLYDHFQGPRACGDFTCNCGNCGLCEFREEVEQFLAARVAELKGEQK